MSKYRKVDVKEEIVVRVERFIAKHPEYGYATVSDFIEDAVAGGLRKIKHILYVYVAVMASLLLVLAYMVFSG